jgi:hypothetical protein
MQTSVLVPLTRKKAKEDILNHSLLCFR